MKLKTGTVVLCIMSFVAVTICTPVATPNDHDIRKCQPNFCQIAKFKCISQDSCNGTLVPQTEPCQCCPICVKFKDIGEPCEERLSEISKNNFLPNIPTPTTASDSSTRTLNETSPQTNNEKHLKNNENKCKPGLTCLQGNCVIIF